MFHTSTRRRERWFAILLLVGCFHLFLWRQTAVRDGMLHGLSLCAETLIPALFPFLVLTNLMVAAGTAETLGRVLAAPCRYLFGLGGASAAAVVLGLCGGYPVGANTAVSLYQANKITRAEAEALLPLATAASPPFLLGAVGLSLWGDVRVGVLLFAAGLLSQLLVGICHRVPPALRSSPSRAGSVRRARLSDLVVALPRAADTMLVACASVLFFEVLLAVLFAGEILSALPFLQTAVAGTLEVSAGVVSAAAKFGGRAPAAGLCLSGFAVGWSGVSVALQVAVCARDTDLSLAPYLRFKCEQAVLCAALTLGGSFLLFS